MTDTRHKSTIEIGVDDRDLDETQKKIQRTFDPRAVEAFTRNIERATKSFEKMGVAAKKAGMPATGGSFGGNTGGGGGGGGSQIGLSADISALRRAIQELADQNKKTNEREEQKAHAGRGSGRGMAAMSAAAGFAGGVGVSAISGGFVGTLASSIAQAVIPIFGEAVGQVLSAGAQQAVALYQEYAQQQMAQAGAFGRTGVAGGYVGEGARYGLQPGQMPGILSQLSGSSGLDGSRLTSALPVQLRLSQLLGVEGAGGIVGAAETAGGRVSDPSELMLQAVSEGLAIGIRTTRLDQYLQNVSGWVEGVRSQGLNLSPESAMRMISGMAIAGLQGEAAVGAARSMSDSLATAGRGRGLAHALAISATGFGQPGGPDYHDALMMLEDRENHPQLMENFVGRVRGMGGSTGQRAYLMRTLAEGLGGSMTETTADGLMRHGFANVMAGGTDGATDLIEQRRRAAGGVFTAGAETASIAAQRIAVGGRRDVRTAAVDLMRRDTEMIALVLPTIARTLGQFNEVLGPLLRGFVEGGPNGGPGGAAGAAEAALITAEELILPALGASPAAMAEGAESRANEARIVGNIIAHPINAVIEAGRRLGERAMETESIGNGATSDEALPEVSGGHAQLERHLRNAADAAGRLGRSRDSDLTSAPV
ncbi:MAG: hypothetical protein M3Q55_15345 [Acidobacteriota bacterium]|nr:hypothetical protein [Acidobacteriota bacterium]